MAATRRPRLVLPATVIAVLAVIMPASIAPAALGVFSFDRLRLGSAAGPENYLFTAGDLIYPEGGADAGSFYRFVVTDSSGAVRNPGFPCLSASSFETADNSYAVKAADPTSTSSPWRYTLNQYADASCSGTPAKTAFKSFYVARARAFENAALTVARSVFGAGATAYVTVAGLRSGADWSASWLLPSAATACANTAGSDRPDASSSGRLPSSSGTFLQYQPNATATGSAWNRESTYETRPCPAFASANEGGWKLRLQLNSTHFVVLSAFAVDGTPPPTPTIDLGPPDPSNSASASFSFSDSEPGTSFLCRLDAQPFAACGSPKSYSALAGGPHTFQVKARDGALNESAPSSHAWTVDTAAPETTITARPPDNSPASTASFHFSASESGVIFQCRLDEGAFAGCASPQSYSGLADGPHTFQVKARDAAGNDEPVPASAGWTVDTVAPALTLTSPADGSSSTDAIPTFAGVAGTATGDAATVAVDVYSGTTATGTPYQTLTATRGVDGSYAVDASQPLASGVYTARARQSDLAGNESASTANTFTVEQGVPESVSPPTISGAPFVGEVLTTTDGTWTHEPTSYLYQWQRCAASPSDCSDIAGADDNTLTLTADDVGSTIRVRVTASNAVGSATATSAQTAPIAPEPPPDPVVATAGDIACGPGSAVTATTCRHEFTSDLLVGRGLTAVLPLGDLQYESGQLSNFQQAYHPTWGRVYEITHPVPGNHEYYTSGAAGYYAYWGSRAGNPSEGWYSYDVGDWHMIALNSEISLGSGSAQDRWLAADLAAHDNVCTLAYFHKPRFSSASHGNDSNMGFFWERLYAAGADVVLNGHDHNYERFALQDPQGRLDTAAGIREFVVGTGGKSLRPFPTALPTSEVRNSTTYGALVLTLHPTSYSWQFVPEAGATSGFTDSGTASCH